MLGTCEEFGMKAAICGFKGKKSRLFDQSLSCSIGSRATVLTNTNLGCLQTQGSSCQPFDSRTTDASVICRMQSSSFFRLVESLPGYGFVP